MNSEPLSVCQVTSRRITHRSGSCVASYPLTSLFPPRERPAFHEAVLNQILQERVVSSRGQCRPRGVKRKMSNFPLRPRGACRSERIEYSTFIIIIK